MTSNKSSEFVINIRELYHDLTYRIRNASEPYSFTDVSYWKKEIQRLFDCSEKAALISANLLSSYFKYRIVTDFRHWAKHVATGNHVHANIAKHYVQDLLLWGIIEFHDGSYFYNDLNNCVIADTETIRQLKQIAQYYID